MKTIEIIVTPGGKSQVQTKGFVGGECQQASRFLETALGETTSEKLTAEFYASAKQQDHLQQET